MDLCLGGDEEHAESLWVRIKGRNKLEHRKLHLNTWENISHLKVMKWATQRGCQASFSEDFPKSPGHISLQPLLGEPALARC